MICLSPVPLMLTTNKASTVVRRKTIRFPFGDQSPGIVVAAGTRGDLREATAIGGSDRVDAVLTAVIAERLAEEQPSVRRRAAAWIEEPRVPRVDDAERSVVGVDDRCAAAERRPAGRNMGASENHIGHSPVSVGAWMSRWPVPSGLTR